ncbi:MAG: tRNA dihydrouridine(20/20a) synthase DusA, partial [Pseudomonadota bacterium]
MVGNSSSRRWIGRLTYQDYRFSVAPMMDWTDRHCRVFHRLLSRRTRLY